MQRDDDRYWHLGGFVYANRDDPAVLVHQRAGGFQWTVNLGHPVGWGIGAVLAAIVLVSVAATAFDLPGASNRSTSPPTAPVTPPGCEIGTNI